MTSIRIECDNPKELLAWAKGFCEHHGYSVFKVGKWEATGRFCERVGISVKHFKSIRARHGCPPFETEEGPTGRVNRVLVNDALEQFCKTHKS